MSDAYQEYAQDILDELHFISIEVNVLLEVADKEQDRILNLWNRVIDEIERRQLENDGIHE
jgi:hypothetical protein|tara:strand:- start:367 stop:549 length:183 start_codon:yes stop_codon:yes gene_type:complete